MLRPQFRSVSSRTRSLNRSIDFEWMRMRVSRFLLVKLNPRKHIHHGRVVLLFSSFTFNLSLRAMNRDTLSITRVAARWLRTKMIKSSAYRTKRRPRRSSSLSSSSSTIFESKADNGPPCGVPLFGRFDQSSDQHAGDEDCPDELQQPFIMHSCGKAAQQTVVVYSIEEFR